MNRLAWPDIPIGLLLGLFAAAALYALNNGDVAHTNYFLPLAQAWLDGRLGLVNPPSWLNEVVVVGGKAHVVYPPAPVLPILPVLLINGGQDFNQALVSIILGAALCSLMYWLLLALGQARLRALGLSIVMLFGTVTWFSAQLGSAWHYAHIAALFFAYLALLAWLLRWPSWIIGLLWAGASLSRTAMLPGAVVFAFLYLARASAAGDPRARISLRLSQYDWPQLFRSGFGFSLGLLLPLIAYAFYNDARFGSPWQTGHELIPQLAQEWQYRNGFFSLTSVPRNLYAMLLNTPGFIERPPYLKLSGLGGLSLLLTTPLFLWVLKARQFSFLVVGAWLSIALVLVPILLHGDVGGFQYGYRYAQDIYPFLLILLAVSLPLRLGFEHYLAIALGFAMSALAAWTKLTGSW